MILTKQKIIAEVKKGSITIEPFSLDQVNPNSYNYRLSNTLLELDQSIIDAKHPCTFKEISLSENGRVLQPGRLYLSSTAEKIGSEKYVTQLIGRSSIGRLGVFLQITAPLGHLGMPHSWTLEIKCVQPTVLYPNMIIGQVSFWNISGSPQQFYQAGYTRFNAPQISKFYEEH